MTAPRRRWSFGLRTLFVVVTVFGIGLSYTLQQWMIAQQRRRMMHDIGMRGGPAIVVIPVARVGWVRECFGDAFWDAISIPQSMNDSCGGEIRRLFPESLIETRPDDYPENLTNWSPEMCRALESRRLSRGGLQSDATHADQP
jgi:hypothetical protein